ncbi:MAG TPA: hypothetical protein VFQ25_15005 [Ktedonobacterales bacterium]|nr:hypothetical protein [Ktedonobacterales bacterium]
MPAIDASQVPLLEALVAVLQTVVLVVAGFVAWRQLREAQRARFLGAIIRMYDDLGNREAYEDADAALGLPPRIEEYTPEELELATWTTRVYEKLAFLVESGMIPAEYIIPLYSRRIVWTWDALQPFIQEQRRVRDDGGAYRMSGDGRYFELLAKRALAYRERTFKGSKRAHPPVPLAYRERVREMVARGERLGSGGYHR